MTEKKLHLAVGSFVLAGCFALVLLVVQVAGFSFTQDQGSYTLKAKFDNIGGLKVRSPVKLGGVVVGRVEAISLDAKSYTPVVTLRMDQQYGFYPETSSLAILTAGLLGEQFIGLRPGFMDDDIELLGEGDFIDDTKSALVLEDLIGQFLFSIQDNSKE
ncbi:MULTISPECIES: outer membrane lipid asymmetry maintenance protein MlaD [unclassified Motilimonas]|uniref:outer membrane lipid asymmetry maintenance protein MlaD n=1 Tax=Motilimonas TaxID=1914248 RepID=UPI001E636E37|nr:MULTISPECIES: outer membrane lipid asymmetry maintenance protein MlaD [unclassified Motilimonas]MCE0555775.1 outer membrane lipid asymmetry maintenance protein MlaD [Motilimonas sp. E26]MDO6524176.1 outer membrane lipid asymmetry maintenance protein MlaD [Motilimonas sp. 1_MG-2023]